MHLGFNNDVLHVTTLIPERPFQACPHHPIKRRGWESSILPGTSAEPASPVHFFSLLPVSGICWMGLELWAIPVPSLRERRCRSRQLLLPLLRNSVNFGPCSRLSKSTGGFPLFALSYGAAVIVLHHLLEHF